MSRGFVLLFPNSNLLSEITSRNYPDIPDNPDTFCIINGVFRYD